MKKRYILLATTLLLVTSGLMPELGAMKRKRQDDDPGREDERQKIRKIEHKIEENVERENRPGHELLHALLLNLICDNSQDPLFVLVTYANSFTKIKARCIKFATGVHKLSTKEQRKAIAQFIQNAQNKIEKYARQFAESY